MSVKQDGGGVLGCTKTSDCTKPNRSSNTLSCNFADILSIEIFFGFQIATHMWLVYKDEGTIASYLFRKSSFELG